MKSIKLNIFLFAIIGIFASCNSKSEVKETPFVTEKEIYEIVNDICKNLDETSMKDEGQKYFYLIDNDSIYQDKTKNLVTSLNRYFSSEDMRFINQQIQLRKNFKYKKEFLNSKQVLSSKTIEQLISKKDNNNRNSFYELYEEKFGKKTFCSISVPLFSLDKKTVFVKVNRLHGGFSLIYQKVNDKWQSRGLHSWN
jgi:hypothetical protein